MRLSFKADPAAAAAAAAERAGVSSVGAAGGAAPAGGIPKPGHMRLSGYAVGEAGFASAVTDAVSAAKAEEELKEEEEEDTMEAAKRGQTLQQYRDSIEDDFVRAATGDTDAEQEGEGEGAALMSERDSSGAADRTPSPAHSSGEEHIRIPSRAVNSSVIPAVNP